MPYFVFRVSPYSMPHKLAEFAAFGEASGHAKALRAAIAPDMPGPVRIKVMFAADERLAEELLCQVREPEPLGDD